MFHGNARIILSVTLLHSYVLSSAVPFQNLKKKSSADASQVDSFLEDFNPALDYYKQFLVQEAESDFGGTDDKTRKEAAKTGANLNSNQFIADWPKTPLSCLSLEYLIELKDRFTTKMDRNDDGKADFDEMVQFLRTYKPNVSNATVRNFINRRDTNGNGKIDFLPEYVRDIAGSDYTDQAAREYFNLDDTNGDGFVSRDELLATAMRLGTAEEEAFGQVSNYYMTHDVDDDGKLSWDEYKKLFMQ